MSIHDTTAERICACMLLAEAARARGDEAAARQHERGAAKIADVAVRAALRAKAAQDVEATP